MNFYMPVLDPSPAGTVIRCWCSYLASVCDLFSGSDGLLWWIVFFTVFLWNILFLLFWGFHLKVKVRPIDINTTSNSKQCGKGHMSEGHSSSKHDFPSFGILMSRHKMILKKDKTKALWEEKLKKKTKTSHSSMLRWWLGWNNARSIQLCRIKHYIFLNGSYFENLKTVIEAQLLLALQSPFHVPELNSYSA